MPKITEKCLIIYWQLPNAIANMQTSAGTPQSRVMMNELKAIIATLDDGYRIPFMMHYRGYAYDEIAEQLDLKMGTVKSRIFYARKQLKKDITGKYGEKILRAA